MEVLDAKAWLDGDKLRISITAVVDGVEETFAITYRRKNGTKVGHVRRRDVETRKRVVKAIEVTGKRPSVDKDGDVEGYAAHLQGFMKYKELYETSRQWLNPHPESGLAH